MTISALTTQAYVTPQKSSRGGRTIDRFIQHHAVSRDWRAVLGLMMGAKEVSANYIIGNDGEIISVVPEEFRAWTSSSAEWDGRAITVEVCNETLAPAYTISAAAQESLSALMADVSKRYGFPLVRDGADSTVLGHRELYQFYGASYATACPGGLPIDATVVRANTIKAGKPAPRKEEDDMPKTQLIRNATPTDKTFGRVAAVNPATGFYFGLPNWEYLPLLTKYGIIDQPVGADGQLRNLAPTDARDVPANEFNFVTNLAATVRAANESAGAVDAALADDFAKLAPTSAANAIK
ncbi:peptidoglycan recognition family protein [Plantibacter sp. M259]|uniref:peptidoglycan recognition protein family protein n=1 Tax=Plantibacter sp. M259 TaxID=2583822 RepID=UPI0011105474|nr:peptidoglycan recognition family protein [Plantibacter sp. M259]